MGRLSAYAKNRILKLRFKKNKRIIHIVDILKRDDNIKVSRQAVSTFLKKYLETNSIYDKPRTGRKRKLTQEEIQLIGQVTRLNRDITARAIKEYLNLNVSTYTILRATKLFEWNKVNPNSNESKKARLGGEDDDDEEEDDEDGHEGEDETETTAGGVTSADGTLLTTCEAVETAAAGFLDAEGVLTVRTVVEMKSVVTTEENNVLPKKKGRKPTQKVKKANSSRIGKKYKKKNRIGDKSFSEFDMSNDFDENDEVEKIQLRPLVDQEMKKNNNLDKANAALTIKGQPGRGKTRHSVNSIPEFEKIDLNLLPHNELLILKNLSCSPMSFATKILFKVFKIDELHGHNVSGKTLNKNLKAKLPLDPVRVGYIKFLVEKYYDEKECKEMLCGVTSNKQDLWKSCHTAINKSILISERKAAAAAAAGKTFVYGDTSLLNFSDSVAAFNKKTSGESNSDMNSSLDGDDEQQNEAVAVARIKSKQQQQRKGNLKSSKYSEGSESDEYDDLLMLPNHLSGQNHHDGDDEFEHDDSGCQPNGEFRPLNQESALAKAAALKRRKDQAMAKKAAAVNGKHRSAKRFKLHLGEDASSDNDEEQEEEIELIQNIRNRIMGKTTTTTANNSAMEKPSVVVETVKEESSEATAAANIAASMKKRYVVVAAIEQENGETEALTTIPAPISTEIAAGSSIKLPISAPKPAPLSSAAKSRQINKRISPPPRTLPVPSAQSSATNRNPAVNRQVKPTPAVSSLPQVTNKSKSTSNLPPSTASSRDLNEVKPEVSSPKLPPNELSSIKRGRPAMQDRAVTAVVVAEARKANIVTRSRSTRRV